jgi:hypothetical protein
VDGGALGRAAGDGQGGGEPDSGDDPDWSHSDLPLENKHDSS